MLCLTRRRAAAWASADSAPPPVLLRASVLSTCPLVKRFEAPPAIPWVCGAGLDRPAFCLRLGRLVLPAHASRQPKNADLRRKKAAADFLGKGFRSGGRDSRAPRSAFRRRRRGP